MDTLKGLGWALALAGCTYSATGPELRTARVGEPFTLAPGETVQVVGTGLSVQLVRVTGDSRCPVDAVCVWEGDAAVEIVTDLAGEATAHTLHTSGDPRVGARAAEREGYRVALEELGPEPRSGRTIPAPAYRATLRVSVAD